MRYLFLCYMYCVHMYAHAHSITSRVYSLVILRLMLMSSLFVNSAICQLSHHFFGRCAVVYMNITEWKIPDDVRSPI